MEKLVEQALLFDFYGELLTDHQRQVKCKEKILDSRSFIVYDSKGD